MRLFRQKVQMVEKNKELGHDFFSFFVCRNPVDKLLSIYNFNVFRRFVSFGSWNCKHPFSTEHDQIVLERSARLNLDPFSTEHDQIVPERSARLNLDPGRGD